MHKAAFGSIANGRAACLCIFNNGERLVDIRRFVNKYMTDITTLMQERMVKYIMGTDTESHDAFREKLKSYNIEECTKRYQDAVDRYNAK